MQVDTHQQAGSELYAWRQFLGRATLWLGVVLLGSAVVCWVAANWPAMTKIQRFAGAQGLLALSAVIAAWVAWRLREATGVRRHGVGALLVLAGLFLGRCWPCWVKLTRLAPIPGNCSPGGRCCCCHGRWPAPARRSGCFGH